MRLQLRDNLPFCEVSVVYRRKIVSIVDTLIDTGSARTVFAADLLSAIGVAPEPNDVLETIRGVGGTEIVYTRQVDYVQVGENRVSPFLIEVGAMDYGFEIGGILGMDFLQRAGAILNLAELVIEFR